MINSGFFKAFKYATNGVTYFLLRERNARFHLLSTILVVSAGMYFQLAATEWLFILSAITAVWVTEMINTAIEKICDHVTQEKNPAIKVIKDVAAGSVLIAAVYALITGAIIFIPKIL
ncbi:diacylglycerol kinase family protein [Gynurincola endophyticus]|jgi:diacylglycerol kinase|uniref:diacylglycerol kinase family protein n=1 Tax=Gynurincola endophyticus TaxID=2479004 RepID=UPI000F8C8890|nr:diacylglycerol kinase family protein [Gynurincola endophyticus]